MSWVEMLAAFHLIHWLFGGAVGLVTLALVVFAFWEAILASILAILNLALNFVLGHYELFVIGLAVAVNLWPGAVLIVRVIALAAIAVFAVLYGGKYSIKL